MAEVDKVKDADFIDDLVEVLTKHGWALYDAKFNSPGDSPFDEALTNPNMSAAEFVDKLRDYTSSIEVKAIYIGEGYSEAESVIVGSLIDGVRKNDKNVEQIKE